MTDEYKFGTWYPIESAPPQAKKCLVFVDLKGEHVLDRSHIEIAYYFTGKFYTSNLGTSAREFKPQPTHWMPLPNPPEKE